MPVVPTEDNKVGIAGLTDAKLRPGDFSGSGLEALGSGLQKVGRAGEELGTALGTTSPAPATPKPPSKAEEGGQREVKAGKEGVPVKTLLEQTPKQASDDAAVKAASNRYFEGVRPSLYQGNDALAEKQGGLALAAVPATAAHVIQTRDDAAADLTPEQHAAFHAAIAPRVTQDLNWIKGLADAQAKVAQQQQSLRVMNNSAQDAVLQYGSPAFGEHMATGLKQIDEQAAAGGWTAEARVAAETGYISGVHRGVSDSLSVSDPVAAADLLRVFGDHMTAEDRAAAWQSLRGPLVQTQAVADLDTLAIARSATAPLTPHGDDHRLMQRMLAITPAARGTGANAPTDLPALLARYGGDAAKAWAASQVSADALDALVAKRGASWFSALPTETRHAVAANMAMLEAVSSPRSAPTPAEGAALAGEIEDQPWSDERKQNAYDELNTRIALGARRDKEAQDSAKESGFAMADQLGAGFISVNQLPPAVRDTLAPDALAALVLRADRNVHAVTVAAHGNVAMSLNRMAATDPETFAKEDLRLHRDEMTPAEYDALDRVQRAWGGFPPGAHGVTQQRALERVWASGLDTGEGETIASQYEDATGSARSTQPPPTDEEVDRLANVETIPAALRGADTTKAAVREMLRNGWTPDQIQNQLYDAHVRRALGHGEGPMDQSVDTGRRSDQWGTVASEDWPDEENNAAGTERTAQLMPIAYGKAKSRSAQAKRTTAPLKAPAWVKKHQESMWRSPNYLSSSRDEDAYKAVRRMGNPDGWTIVYTHGVPTRDGKVIDRHLGLPDIWMPAIKIFDDLRKQAGYDPKATILLTACYGANDTTARDLSKLTHGTVYVAKGYVSEPSVENNRYRLTVNDQYGKRTGFAKFVDGVEAPSTLLSLSYDRETHSWKFGVLKKAAPVGDRSRSPGKEPWYWRLFHPH
ncbi:MAG: hypothetical protein ABI240_09915 [Sphingomonas sp.]